MRKIRIVADSSANVLALQRADFSFAPLKIITAEKEFVDNETLDVNGMIDYFDAYKGRSQTSCPNPSDWLEAFGDADRDGVDKLVAEAVEVLLVLIQILVGQKRKGSAGRKRSSLKNYIGHRMYKKCFISLIATG